MGSQVSWPVERVGLGVVPRLRGHLLLGSTTSLASLQEVMSPQLLGGRVQGAVAKRAMPLPHQSGLLVSVEPLPLELFGVETPWQQLMDGLGP